jgi:K+-transporting ATPase ATPase A chain
MNALSPAFGSPVFLDWAQILFYFAVLFLTVKPLGQLIAKIYQGERTFLSPCLGWLETLLSKAAGINPDEEMDWKHYAKAVLGFSLVSFTATFLLLLFQDKMPFLNDGKGALSPDLAFNIASSFITNTNWQSYTGEADLSRFSQFFVLTIQNFFSAAVGMSVLAATIRGFARKKTEHLGNFWADLIRGILYILLPLSFLLGLALVSQGVVQSVHDKVAVEWLDPSMKTYAPQQIVPLGPVASQTAIQQLGTNGGGYYAANLAHPLANPTPFSNFLEMLAMLLLPASLCYAFGAMIGDRKQGWMILLAMSLLLLPFLYLTLSQENAASLPSLSHLVEKTAMEGKETRFGASNTAFFATLATATGTGSMTGALDSFKPLGGLAPLALIQLGEVVFGGTGSGLYGMLVFIILAVFVAGLMVGRTPEYLGKKIGVFEMKMASLVILIPPLIVLFGSAIAVLTEAGRAGVAAPSAHGFTQILYAFSSAGNNNGSAFAGLQANAPFYNYALGIVMLMGRYLIIPPILALAGSLAQKNTVPESAGTLSTTTTLFVFFLMIVVLLVGVLTFVPALALGPIAEHLNMLNPISSP